jgi:hypothetical protein
MASRNFGNVKAAAVNGESDQKKAPPRKAGKAGPSRATTLGDNAAPAEIGR